MTALARDLTRLCWSALHGDAKALDHLRFESDGGLPAAFAVTDIASAAIAAAALAIAELAHQRHGRWPSVTVDRRLASIWFHASIRPIDWRPVPPWDPIAGDYPTRDGWIRLHTNAPHHRAAVERVVGARGERDAVARAVATWSGVDLENAVIEAGGCAAEMRSVDAWQRHPQGQAVAAEPLVHLETAEPSMPPGRPVEATRPLAGVRVLDLTRVLAGPVATRFLAGFGADVLRIDPPDWDEPAVVPEMTLGKHCARLDLRTPEARATFERLLASADVLVHGYRPGALHALGYDAATRRRLAPGLVDVSLDAYGWSGPWAMRRGFDSLVQMSSGIADFGMRRRGADKPVPLPVQALDHATGYLMAAAAIRGLLLRLQQGPGSAARLSLARTAQLVIAHPLEQADAPFAPETAADRSPPIEATDWGAAQRIRPPVQIENAPMTWTFAARGLGSAAARWEES